MTRLTRKTVEELTAEQRDLFDEIIANRPVRPRNGHIGGPFDMWVADGFQEGYTADGNSS